MRAKSKLHVTGIMQDIIDNEGEGVILRRPNSLYDSGRTESLLKLKVKSLMYNYSNIENIRRFEVIEKLLWLTWRRIGHYFCNCMSTVSPKKMPN